MNLVETNYTSLFVCSNGTGPIEVIFGHVRMEGIENEVLKGRSPSCLSILVSANCPVLKWFTLASG